MRNTKIEYDKKIYAPGRARTADIRMAHTVYKYGALTDWATGADATTFHISKQLKEFRDVKFAASKPQTIVVNKAIERWVKKPKFIVE